MIAEEGYKNEHLDRAVAVMILIVFFVGLFYALTIITQAWAFFRWFFAGVVVLVACWIIVMLYSIVWRYNAKTQAVIDSNSIIQVGQTVENNRPEIHSYQPSDYPDYNSFFADDDD